MDPATLIPSPDTIPVHWIWFQLLLLVTFYIHILLMNIMLGTIIIALVSHVRKPQPDTALTHHISENLPFSIALAVNFGVAPLLFVQVLYGHFVYASSILMAPLWLSIVGILIAAYYGAYIYKYSYDKLIDGKMLLTGFISSMLLVIGFLFCSNFTLMLHPESWPHYFDHPSGLFINFADPTLIPRYLHFVVSSLAVGGLAIALFFRKKQLEGDDKAKQWIHHGCNWFGYATFVNFAIGFWFFGALPKGLIHPSSFVGALFSLSLLIGIITAVLAAIHGLRYKIMPAVYLLLTAVFFMILAREFLRVAYLKPWFSLADLEVASSYSPLFFFLLFFGAGLLLIGWMLKITWQTYHNGEVSR
ncbi:MAG: hypothetical protein DSY70_00775 [Desulfobulbus sp.]|nr:MAG: hypothetical protein DSY70_00775 [Desulfobulbus sp.]